MISSSRRPFTASEELRADVLKQAVNFAIQSGASEAPGGRFAAWLLEAVIFEGPWLDELEKRPVRLHLEDRCNGSEMIPVEDVLTGKRWKCDYQCMRRLTEMEVLAWSAV